MSGQVGQSGSDQLRRRGRWVGHRLGQWLVSGWSVTKARGWSVWRSARKRGERR